MKTKVTANMADEDAEAAAEDRESNYSTSGETKGDDVKVEEEEGEGEYAWHTWIDYPKWTKLVNKFHATNGKAKFSKLDYVARTPSWALYGAPEAGFSPYEVHFKRRANGRTVTNEKSASASEIAKATSVGIELYHSDDSGGEGGCG